MIVWMKVAACERNVRSPGTCWERGKDDVRSLVPLDRGLSASGSAHSLPLSYIQLSMNRNSLENFIKFSLFFHVLRLQ